MKEVLGNNAPLEASLVKMTTFHDILLTHVLMMTLNLSMTIHREIDE